MDGKGQTGRKLKNAKGSRQDVESQRTLFWLVLIGAGTVLVELVLLGHFEDLVQWIPIAILSLTLVSGAIHALRLGQHSLRLLATMFALMLASGPVGLFFHYRSNVEFELEMHPDAAGLTLFWESLRGAMPVLAPGTMIYLGLLGFLYARSARHQCGVQRNPEI